MVAVLLRMLDVLRAPMRMLGVDHTQCRAILEAKLTMDTRRPLSTMGTRMQGRPRNALTTTLLVYGLMGTFVGLLLLRTGSPLVAMTIVHAMVMTMIAMSLIADFSSVLLDTTDNAILQPRPVTGRTILAARIAHIVIYVTLLVVSLCACTFIIGTLKYHYLFPLVFLATLGCSVLLVVFVAHVFYLVAMRLTNTEKLRDIILYCQIGMTVLVFGGYQLLPRLMDISRLKTLTIDDQWWIYLAPPAWMAAPIDMLTGHVGPVQLVLTALAVLVPAAGVLLVALVLAPEFGTALARLDASPTPGTHDTPYARKGRIRRAVSRIVCRAPAEHATFELVWALGSRDRQYKLRTYPTVAFLFVFGFVMIFSDDQGLKQALATLPDTSKHLYFLYFAAAMVPMAIIQQRYSASHDAAWTYRALPLERPGLALMGALKAVITRYVVPIFAVVSLPILCLWGVSAVADVVLALCATLLVCALDALLFGRCFPFSEPFSMTEGSGRMIKSMLLMGIPAALGGAHYALSLLLPVAVLPAAALVLLLALVPLSAYAKTTWTDLAS
ncbi:MAG: hypothetical protein ACE5E6_01255 [Phycisphaerae bacterium]